METIVLASEIRKSYGDVQALRGVSFTVSRGEVVGFLGPNGAGKTTLMECILGVRTPDGGTSAILGMDAQRERKRLFRRVGVQFQQSAVQEKIRVGELCACTAALYPVAADWRALLRRFGLGEMEKRLVSELSGGERQKLFVALALLPNPDVVFLDELTTGLDARARRDVWKSLLELKVNGLTIVLTSHFMDEVEALCDRIHIMKGGAFLFSGTVAEAVAASPHARLEDAYLWFTDEEVENHEGI